LYTKLENVLRNIAKDRDNIGRVTQMNQRTAISFTGVTMASAGPPKQLKNC